MPSPPPLAPQAPRPPALGVPSDSSEPHIPSRTLEPDDEARRELATTLVQPRHLSAVLAENLNLPPLALGGILDGPSADLQVIATLGEGGAGSVHLARQGSLDRLVAVKVLRDEALDSGLSLVSEARVAARVEHPNVVPIYLLGKTPAGSPVLVMKNIRGVSWLDLANRTDDPLWARLAPAGRDRVLVHLEILVAVCNAVDAAHREGILHRDVKPSNVMVAGPGEVYLMDWGIAVDRTALPPTTKLSVVGTPAYMPPEMLSGDPRDLDERADVFMLGASLHYILTGRLRNPGNTNEEAFESLRNLAPYDYGHAVPDELAAICNRATAPDRADRFASVAELRAAIHSFLDHHAAIQMSERARATIDVVERLPRADPATARQLDEARLVLHGALAAWPESALAQAQLERLRHLQVEVELARRHGSAARAALDTLRAPRPALVDAVASLEAEERVRREREARDAALAHDHDLATAARTRRWFFSLLGAYAIALGVVITALRLDSGEDGSGLRHIASAGVTTSFYLAMLWVARRDVLANRANRIVMGLVGTTFGFNLLHRLVAYAYGGSPRLTLTVDTLVMGLVCALGALMLTPRLWIAAAACAVGVVVSTVAPGVSLPAFGVCAVFMLWRMSREWGGDPR